MRDVALFTCFRLLRRASECVEQALIGISFHVGIQGHPLFFITRSANRIRWG
jgi:hypothetical protein